MIKRISLLTLVATGLTVLFSSNAFAVSATASISLSTTVPVSCNIQANGAITFNVTNKSQEEVSQSSFSVNCDTGVPYSVVVSNGLYSKLSPIVPGCNPFVDNPANCGGNPTGERRLGNGGLYLNYFIYEDSSRTTEWRTKTGLTGSGSNQTYQVFAVLPAVNGNTTQFATPGNYSDTVTISLNY